MSCGDKFRGKTESNQYLPVSQHWAVKIVCTHTFESESEVAQSCPTLCNPVDYSLPGSSVHGILQARILEWVTISDYKAIISQLSGYRICLQKKKRICLQCRRPGFDPWVRKIPWRRKWQPPPAFLPGESHEQRSLAGYSPWGCKNRTRLKIPLVNPSLRQHKTIK